MSSIWVKFANWRNGNHGVAYRTRLFGYDEYVPASDLAAARAENERLTILMDLSHKTTKAVSKKTTETVLERAEKAEAERDEALALLADAYGAGTGGSVIESRLADAERDMRRRAANTASLYGQGKQGIAASEMIQQAILALPLKHAEKEEKQ